MGFAERHLQLVLQVVKARVLDAKQTALEKKVNLYHGLLVPGFWMHISGPHTADESVKVYIILCRAMSAPSAQSVLVPSGRFAPSRRKWQSGMHAQKAPFREQQAG